MSNAYRRLRLCSLRLFLLVVIVWSWKGQSERELALPRENLRDACKEDIEEYCPGQVGAFAYACLELNKSNLSDSCKGYLGKSFYLTCFVIDIGQRRYIRLKRHWSL